MAKKLFKENQRFKNLEIIIIIFLFVAGIINKLLDEVFAPTSSFELTITLSFLLLSILSIALYYLYKLRLKVAVNKKHISFSMPPLQKRKEKIKWKDVATCEIIQTPLTAQWHGGNIAFNHEKRFSLNGRNGVHITTKEGAKYFIGSKKLDDLKTAIQTAIGGEL